MSAVALLIGDSIALATAEGKCIYVAPFQACHNGFSKALLRSEGWPGLGLEAEILRHTVLVLLHLQPGRVARSWVHWHTARHSLAGG